MLPCSDVAWDGNSDVAVLRLSSGGRTLRVMSHTSQNAQEWRANAESAILLDGYADVEDEKLPAPIAIIGDLTTEGVRAVPGDAEFLWLVFTSSQTGRKENEKRNC